MFWGHKEEREEKEEERWWREGGGREGEEMLRKACQQWERYTPPFHSHLSQSVQWRSCLQVPSPLVAKKDQSSAKKKTILLGTTFHIKQFWSVVSFHISLCCMVTWPVAHDWLKIMWLETHSPVHVSWCHWHWQSRPASPTWCSVASHEDPTHPVEYQSPEREEDLQPMSHSQTTTPLHVRMGSGNETTSPRQLLPDRWFFKGRG